MGFDVPSWLVVVEIIYEMLGQFLAGQKGSRYFKLESEPELTYQLDVQRQHEKDLHEWDVQMEIHTGKPIRYLLDPTLEERELQQSESTFYKALQQDFGRANAHAAMQQMQQQMLQGQFGAQQRSLQQSLLDNPFAQLFGGH